MRPRLLALATAFVLLMSACTPDHHSSSNVASSIGSAAPALGEAGPAAAGFDSHDYDIRQIHDEVAAVSQEMARLNDLITEASERAVRLRSCKRQGGMSVSRSSSSALLSAKLRKCPFNEPGKM